MGKSVEKLLSSSSISDYCMPGEQLTRSLRRPFLSGIAAHPFPAKACPFSNAPGN